MPAWVLEVKRECKVNRKMTIMTFSSHSPLPVLWGELLGKVVLFTLKRPQLPRPFPERMCCRALRCVRGVESNQCFGRWPWFFVILSPLFCLFLHQSLTTCNGYIFFICDYFKFPHSTVSTPWSSIYRRSVVYFLNKCRNKNVICCLILSSIFRISVRKEKNWASTAR